MRKTFSHSDEIICFELFLSEVEGEQLMRCHLMRSLNKLIFQDTFDTRMWKGRGQQSKGKPRNGM